MSDYQPTTLSKATTIPSTWYLHPAFLEREREKIFHAIAFSHQVQLEDVAISNLVQKGLRSRSYDRGRLSVRRENGVHFFHGLLHEHLGR